MANNFFDLHSLYSVSGILITLLYIPQLLSVVRAQNTLNEISMVTWGLWTVCLSISSLYALQVAGDVKIALVSMGGTLFCALITSVTAFKRVKYKSHSLPIEKKLFSKVS